MSEGEWGRGVLAHIGGEFTDGRFTDIAGKGANWKERDWAFDSPLGRRNTGRIRRAHCQHRRAWLRQRQQL